LNLFERVIQADIHDRNDPADDDESNCETFVSLKIDHQNSNSHRKKIGLSDRIHPSCANHVDIYLYSSPS
jgi:hypothetical protein